MGGGRSYRKVLKKVENMIAVKLFGLFRNKTDKYEYSISAARLDELLEKLEIESNIPLKDLKNGVIFVNSKPFEKLKKFKTPLNNGDEVAILSPASGG